MCQQGVTLNLLRCLKVVGRNTPQHLLVSLTNIRCDVGLFATDGGLFVNPYLNNISKLFKNFSNKCVLYIYQPY